MNETHANYDITPIRQQLAWNARATSLEVRNRGAHAARFEVEPQSWGHNADGTFATALTEDVTVTPKQFELKPGAVQIVRIFFHTPPDPQNEQRWRILLREHSRDGHDASAEQGTSLQVLFHISTPIFRLPKGAEAQLQWSVENISGQPTARLTNTGARYALLSEFKDSSGNTVPGVGGYVLPGQTRQFPMPNGYRGGEFSFRLHGDPNPALRTVTLGATP